MTTRSITEVKAISNILDRYNVIQASYQYNYADENMLHVPLQNLVVQEAGTDNDGHNLIYVVFESLDTTLPQVDENDYYMWSQYMKVLETDGDADSHDININDVAGNSISKHFAGSITTLAKVDIEDFQISGKPFSVLSFRDFKGNYIKILASLKVKAPLFRYLTKDTEDVLPLNSIGTTRVLNLLSEKLFGFPKRLKVKAKEYSYEGLDDFYFQHYTGKGDYSFAYGTGTVTLSSLDKAKVRIENFDKPKLIFTWYPNTSKEKVVEIEFGNQIISEGILESL